jgi:hypothetical protein
LRLAGQTGQYRVERVQVGHHRAGLYRRCVPSRQRRLLAPDDAPHIFPAGVRHIGVIMLTAQMPTD